MSFHALLRRTKLVALPEPLAPSALERAHGVRSVYPTRQVITAPKANRAVGDWGLKRDLPVRKTAMISLTDLDTVEHQTPFKSANEPYLQRARFQELWMDLRVGHSTTNRLAMAAPLTDPHAVSLATMGGAKFARLVEQVRGRRQEFLDYLREKSIDLESISMQELEAQTEDFLGLKGVPLRVPQTAPTAGLSYAPPTLSNLPDGSGFGERTVPARFLRGRSSGRIVHAVGVGGFTAVMGTVVDNIRQKTRDRARITVRPTKAIMHAAGNLEMTVEPYTPETGAAREKRAQEMDSWAALFPQARSKKRASEHETSEATAQRTKRPAPAPAPAPASSPSADYARILGVLDDYKRVTSGSKVKKYATAKPPAEDES